MAGERLIEAVRAHTELYDTKNANYMKTKLKNRIWNDIANDLNLKDGDEAKTLWLKLRGSYRDARRRQLRCMKSGAASENIKPWRFQKHLSFLDPFMSTGPREGNINDSDDNSQFLPATPLSDENMDSEEIEGNSLRQSERHDLSEVVDGDDIDNSSRRAEFISPNKNNSLTPVVHSKESKKKKQDIQSLFKRSLEQREERAKQRAEERQLLESKESLRDDPLYNFFIAMYQSTKQMSPSYQHKIRSKLFQAVSQAEEEIMNIPSRPLSTLTSSNYTLSPYPSPHTWADSQTPSLHSEQQGNLQRSDISGLADYVSRFEAQ